MEYNKDNFKQEVEENKNLVLVDFFAPWCGPCKLMGPIINELTEEYKDKNIKIGKVDIDENQELASKYNIMGVPTLIFFKEGKIVEQISGYQSKEAVVEIIDKNL